MGSASSSHRQSSIEQTNVEQTNVEQWRTEGWVLLEGLIDAAEVAAAVAELDHIGVGQTDEPRRSGNNHAAAPDDGPAFRHDQFSGTTLFPFHDAPTLNRLVIHPAVVDFARQAIGNNDLRAYQTRLWSKYAGRVNYEQPLHRDRNHSIVPSRMEPAWWYMECFLYLTDVEEDTGAPRLVPRSASVGEPPETPPVSPVDQPQLYAAEIAAPAPAGSLLAYRPDVWHRGVDLTRPGSERHVLVVAYRQAGHEWVGYDPHPPLVTNRHFKQFVSTCGPDELSLFGVPRPGHSYWTPAVLEAMAELYPDLDLTPWHKAL